MNLEELQNAYHEAKDRHREAVDAFDEEQHLLRHHVQLGFTYSPATADFVLSRLRALKEHAERLAERRDRAREALFAFRAENDGQQQQEHDSKPVLTKRAEEAQSKEEQQRQFLKSLSQIQIKG